MTGFWSAVTATCEFGYKFQNGTDYGFRYLCTGSTPTTPELQIIEGKYSVSGSSFTLTPTRATCANAVPETDMFTVDANALTIVSGTSLLRYNRTTGRPSSGTATLGCYLAGGFTPMPLMDL